MVKWPRGLHPQAAKRNTSTFAWRPGFQQSGASPIVPVNIRHYSGKISGVPLTGGQAQAFIPASGTLQLQVGPQGLGGVWYPISVTLSTSTGVLDTSTAKVYLGPSATPATLQASIFSGNGTAALAIPSMSPGQTIIVVWSGAHPGDTAAFNITGTMDALSTGGGR